MKIHLPSLDYLGQAARRSAAITSKSILPSVLLIGLTYQAGAQQFTVSSNWFVTNAVVSATNHISTGDVNRGLAYSVVSNQVFVCNKTTPAIDVLDGTAGTYLGSANLTGVNGGAFTLDQVAVADDGVLYAGNLGTPLSTSSYRLYQWTNWATAPTAAYVGNAAAGGGSTGTRMGDNIAITGSGTNTIVVVPVETSGPSPTTNVVLFSTVNGTTFTPTVLNISGLPSLSGNNGATVGITCYTNNTFLFKPNGAFIYIVQYPANFASLTSPVSATVIATNAFTAGSQLVMNYAPQGNLLAAIGPIPSAAPSTTPVKLYFGSPFNSVNVSVGGTNSPHVNANANFVGGVALGGVGKTNMLYTLDCNNGVYGWGLTYVPAAVAPSISTQPSGATIFTNYGAFTFTVAGAGSTPLSYQWQYSSNNIVAPTNISGATNSSYTLSFLTTNASGYYDVIITNVAGSVTSTATLLTVKSGISSPTVSNLWTLAPGSRPYLGTGDYNTRGIAYDTNTSTVLLSDHATTNIYVLDANTGADLFSFAPQGLYSGSIAPYVINMVGVSDDGIVYFANLAQTQTNGTGDTFYLYTYSSVSSGATGAIVYSGDPGNGAGERWGDTMAVRGAGLNTQILIGSYGGSSGPGTNVALFTTQNGTQFSAITIGVPAPGFSGGSVAFGPGNTFYAKGRNGFNLRQIAFDPTGVTPATIIEEYVSPAQIPNDMTGLAVDATNNLLVGVNFDDTPNDLEFFTLSNNTNAPTLYDQTFFPSANVNSQLNAASVMKFPRVYSLDANNGVLALTYSVPVLPFSLTATAQGSSVVLTFGTVAGHSYQVQSRPSLSSGSFTNVGSPITATATTTTFTNASPTGTLFYRVYGQ